MKDQKPLNNDQMEAADANVMIDCSMKTAAAAAALADELSTFCWNWGFRHVKSDTLSTHHHLVFIFAR